MRAAGFFKIAPGWASLISSKKNIPEITFKNLSPPYKNYEYFQNHELFPFEYRATTFSLINAWWLAEASTLVYADEAYVKQRFREAGLSSVKSINRSGTQCFIAVNDRFAIIAFRGSEIWKRTERLDPGQMISDLKTNIDVRLSDWSRGGRVHSGFKTALDDIWDEVLPEIRMLEAQGIKIWLTGHSQGAALATLAADRLKDVQGLYTFGSPRVGDQDFQERFRPKAFRMVNGNDIVASVPPEGPFRHIGELKLICPKTDTPDQPGNIEESVNASCLDASNDFERGEASQAFNSGLFIPSFIRNHVPLLYSILLWNELVESVSPTAARRNETATYTLEVGIEGRDQTAPASEAAPLTGGPFDRTLELQGIRFRVASTNEGSINTLRIVPGGLEIDNSPIVRRVEGTVAGAKVADLNVDGSPEIYVYLMSSGSGSYGSLVAYSANRRKSLSEIYLPPTQDEVASKGYMGHDEFAVVENRLVRRFPVYRDTDINAKPTGGMRQVQYRLVPGEAGWILKVDRVVEY